MSRTGWLATSALLAVASGAMVVGMITTRPLADAAQATHATSYVRELARTDAAGLDAALQAARAYNARLAAAPVRLYGQAVDPATGTVPADTDTAYLTALDPLGDGTMARLIVPAIDVDVPVLRGTADATLARGAGHLYGTSVPVGGAATHAVITAHSGQVTHTGFLRLDELAVGDAVVVEVLGDRLGYVVDRVEVVSPDDFSRFTIDPDEDRLTLMTCTPVGLNTHRLLVSAVRDDDAQDSRRNP